jgi:hypothetical protein
VDTHGKKEVDIFDKMDSLEQIEEYIETDKKRAEPNDIDRPHHFREDEDDDP